MRLCNRCILPANALNLSFDRDGVCNHCRTYDEYSEILRDFDRMDTLLCDRFDRVRGRFAYDAIVGLSGGKDSSYVAYRLVHRYGLRTLLFTYDNGFLSEHARKNISRVASALEQDHVWCSPSKALHRAIYRTSVRLFGIPCVGCTFPGFLHAVKKGIDLEIPFLVHGRSRAQMFKQLAHGTSDPFLGYLVGNFRPWVPERNREFAVETAKKLSRGLRWFAPQQALREEIVDTFSPDFSKLRSMEAPPEFVAYFLHEPYDEDRIKAVLKEELGWERPPRDDLMGHEDCSVHPAAAYLYTNNYGFPMLQQELSTMIREGDMTRDHAMERLGKETDATEFFTGSMAHLERMTGFDAKTILRFSRRTSRVMTGLRWWMKLKNAAVGRKRLSLPLPREPV